MPKKHIPGGYILLSRRLIDSEIWDKPPMYLKVWLYILTKARHKPEKAFERGEALVSIPELQEVCSHMVGYRKEKPKKHEIDNILRWLRRTSEATHGYDNEEHTNTPMITTSKTTRGMVVKVHNYNVYQDPENYEYDSESDNENDDVTTANTTMLRQQPDTIHKNDKELKNVNKGIRASENDSDESYAHVDKTKDEFNEKFSKFYDLYNKKKARPKAEQAFKKALKKHGFETIMNGTEKFLNTIKDKQYQPYPAKFLNQEQYMDEHDPINGDSNVSGIINSNEPEIQKRHPKKGDPLADVRHLENAID